MPDRFGELGDRCVQVRVTYPTGKSAVYDAAGETIYIGRGEGNDVRLPHPFVSARHLRVRWNRERFSVSDLGSESGTRVAGQRLEPHVEHLLAEGEEIEVGALRLQFELVLEATIDDDTSDGAWPGEELPEPMSFPAPVGRAGPTEADLWSSRLREEEGWGTRTASRRGAHSSSRRGARQREPERRRGGTGPLPIVLGNPSRFGEDNVPQPPVDLPWTAGLKLVGGLVLLVALALLMVILTL